MSLNTAAILDTLVSHALSLGVFEQVNGHEPKNAPGHGVTAAVWVQSIAPARTSGLAASSGLLVVNVRTYTGLRSQPEDAIDPNMLGAVDLLLAAYSGDFTLGGNARNIDLLGQHGQALSAEAGYLTQDGATYRVMTITVPLVINDLWEQAA